MQTCCTKSKSSWDIVIGWQYWRKQGQDGFIYDGPVHKAPESWLCSLLQRRSSDNVTMAQGDLAIPWQLRAGAAPRGVQGGNCPPYDVLFCLVFLLVSSEVSHVDDYTPLPHYDKKKKKKKKKKIKSNQKKKKKKCVGVPPPPPPQPWHCKAGAVARHFATPSKKIK